MTHAERYARKPITDFFTGDTDIDRRNSKRTVPMKVLILGTGRTGTASMRAAMKMLGYVDTYHMMSCSIENPPDALLWMDALKAKYDGVGKPFTTAEDWDQLLGNCQAVCDWPACAFAKELIEAYPEAKVILMMRDPDVWHKSVMKTFYWRVSDPELRYLSRFSWAASMYYPMIEKFFNTFFEGDFPQKGKGVFLKHCEEVRSLVPRESGRLLEYYIGNGWGPLCEFLGDPIPAGRPFPNVNDSQDFVSRSRRRNRMQMLNVATGWVLGLISLSAIATVFRWLFAFGGGLLLGN